MIRQHPVIVWALVAFGTFVVARGGIAQSDAPSADAPGLYADFERPGAAYRGKPFWSWNGVLDKDELIRQIRVLKQMGFGGYFMHSRTGLATEYLGEEWFDLINACADEGEKLGLEAWLYDEDRWPSGSAGGLVTKDPKYRTKYLHCQRLKPGAFVWSDDTLAAFTCRLDGVDFARPVRLKRAQQPDAASDVTVLAFQVVEMAPSSFYNGFTYLDTMNREATDRFIEITHERYKERCGDRLGKSIKGIFFDEPHRGMVMSTFGGVGDDPEWKIPWTGKLPSEFQARFGYDIVERLPELFLRKDGAPVSQIKWHYMECLQQLYLENFVQPIRAWCVAHHMILTGHVLHEDSLSCQTVPQGSVMRVYEYMDYPGVDILTEGNRNYWVAKQLDSAANQFGQKWRLSELYGVTGWQFDFEGHKAVGNWQALLGVNLRCHHLSWYTMQGEAKRDYPASILHQSAWYPYYGHVEDYFARLGVLTSAGQPKCDVLVVNPVESLWAQIRPGWCTALSSADPELQRLETAYRDLFHWLQGSQTDFDYGDEDHIARHGRVIAQPGKPTQFQLGKMAYRAIVVPQMTTIRSTTLDQLDAFIKAGGHVIVTEPVPRFVDALQSNRVEEMSGGAVLKTPFEQTALLHAVRQATTPSVQVVDAEGRVLADVFCRAYQAGDELIVIAMNIHREQKFSSATIRVRGQGFVEEWDCQTGARYRIEPDRSVPGYLRIRTDFEPNGTIAYVITSKDAGLSRRRDEVVVREVALDGPFEFSLNEPNVCVLDYASWKLAERPWQPAAEILKVDQQVRDQLRLAHRGGEMVQPWYARTSQTSAPELTPLELKFVFYVERMPKQPIELALETPELFTVTLNDTAVDNTSKSGWWIDRCFPRIAVPPGALKTGENVLRLSVGFHDQVNLEAVYLLGPFGVSVKPKMATLISLPEKLAIGSVADQGLPFYGGEITYQLPVQKPNAGEVIVLHLPEYQGACVLAGSRDNIMAWDPDTAEVTGHLKDGRVPVTVVLTRRNTFGPLHIVPLHPGVYGPAHWTTGGKQWTDNYQLWSSGLIAPPRIRFVEVR